MSMEVKIGHQILEFVKSESQNGPVDLGLIQQRFSEKLEKQNVNSHLTKLVDKGYLSRISKGKYIYQDPRFSLKFHKDRLDHLIKKTELGLSDQGAIDDGTITPDDLALNHRILEILIYARKQFDEALLYF